MNASKIKHEVTINGKVFVRTSDRPYTHAVIGPPAKNFEVEMTRAESGDLHARWWDVLTEVAEGRSDRRDISPDTARRFAAENPDRDAYIAAGQARDVARVRKADAKGVYGWQPYSWHQGLANAQKALKQCHATAARIVEIGSEITEE